MWLAISCCWASLIGAIPNPTIWTNRRKFCVERTTSSSGFEDNEKTNVPDRKSKCVRWNQINCLVIIRRDDEWPLCPRIRSLISRRRKIFVPVAVDRRETISFVGKRSNRPSSSWWHEQKIFLSENLTLDWRWRKWIRRSFWSSRQQMKISSRNFAQRWKIPVKSSTWNRKNSIFDRYPPMFGIRWICPVSLNSPTSFVLLSPSLSASRIALHRSLFRLSRMDTCFVKF